MQLLSTQDIDYGCGTISNSKIGMTLEQAPNVGGENEIEKSSDSRVDMI